MNIKPEEENIRETIFTSLKEPMDNKAGSKVPFIEMKKESLSLFKDSIQKVKDDYVLIFDIDETLYKGSEEFHQKEDSAYYKAYNTLKEKMYPNKDEIPPAETVLIKGTLFMEIFYKYFGISPDQMEAMREQTCYEKFIQRDEKLRDCLMDLPFRKWAFTNCLKTRALKILECLGMTECFEGVIGVAEVSEELIGKPRESAYKFVEDLLGIESKEKVFFFDDNLFNIKTGEKFGWNSILIKKEDNLVDVLSEIFGGKECC